MTKKPISDILLTKHDSVVSDFSYKYLMQCFIFILKNALMDLCQKRVNAVIRVQMEATAENAVKFASVVQTWCTFVNFLIF